MVEEYLGGKLKVDEFVSHNFSLDKINDAFTVMHEGKRWVGWVGGVARLQREREEGGRER